MSESHIKTANLAPMEGVSEWPFRLWLAMYGGFAEATTPFIRVTDTYPGKKNYLERLMADRHFAPFALIPQLMASSPQRFCEVATELLEDFSFVELNCGCPSPKVYSSRAGSQILADPDYFLNFISTCVDALGPQKLAVKIRLGIHKHSEVFTLIRHLHDLPLRKLTVHGRTKVQGYAGMANWGLIAHAAAELPFPVIGSGDIVDDASFRARMRGNTIHSAIIGRGALINPWIFSEISTGSKAVKTRQLVRLSLITFYLLHAAKLSGHDATDFAGKLDFGAANHQKMWRQNISVMGEILEIKDGSLPHCSKSLGRLKMLWTYLKATVTTDPRTAAKCLRVKNIDDFFQQFDQLSFREETTHNDHIEIVRHLVQPSMGMLV